MSEFSVGTSLRIKDGDDSNAVDSSKPLKVLLLQGGMDVIRYLNKPRVTKYLGCCLKAEAMLASIEDILFTVPFTRIIGTVDRHHVQYTGAIHSCKYIFVVTVILS